MAQTVGLLGVLDINEFTQNVRAFVTGIRQVTSETAKVASTTTSGMLQAASTVTGFGKAWNLIVVAGVFALVKKGIDAITASLGRMLSEGFEAINTFQKLNIQLRGILARDFARQFGGSISQAFVEIEQRAKELFGWIRRIAITTPFSVESLTNALSMSQAFGFNVDQSKKLLLAVGNFTAGMGLSNQQFERIIYNMGQMLASGKVLGRELRDLANNFVPIQDIIQRIADISGKSFAEIREALKEGRISAQQFIAVFVEMAEEDFTGAMERMSRTLQGVKQNFQDFFHTIIGIELLGPVGKKVAEILADFLDKLFRPEVTKFFSALGFSILSVFNNISAGAKEVGSAFSGFIQALGLAAPSAYSLSRALIYVGVAIREFLKLIGRAITGATNFVSQIRAKLGIGLTDLASKAKSWGINIVISLAEGMAQAIASVIRVIGQIARAISSWLSSHSPPKMLPDLPKWGRAAMQSYLDAWATADFGIFNDIAGIITDLMKSLSVKPDDVGLIPRILGTREAIVKAITGAKDAGDVTEKALNKIFKAAKITNPALREYIRNLFEYNTVAARAAEVSDILDFDIDLNTPIKVFGDLVDSIDDLVAVGDKFKTILGPDVLSYIDKAKALSIANAAVEESQKALNDITSKYDEILADLNAQLDALTKKQEDNNRIADIDRALATGRLTDNEKMRLELEKQEITLKQNIRAIESEKSIAEAAAQAKLDSAKEAQDEAERAAEAQRALVQATTDEQLAAIKEQLDASKELVEFQIEQNELIKEQIELLRRLAEAAASGKEGGAGEPFDLENLEDIGQDIGESIEDALPSVQDAIAGLEQYVKDEWEDFWSSLTTPFTGLSLQGIPDAIAGLFEDIGSRPEVMGFLISLEILKFKISDFVTSTSTFLTEEAGPNLAAAIGTFLSDIGIDTSKIKIGPIDWGKLLGGGFLEGIEGLTGLTDGFSKLMDILAPVQGFIQNLIGTVIDNLSPSLKIISENINHLIPVFKELKTSTEPLRNLFGTIAKVMLGAFGGVIIFAVTKFFVIVSAAINGVARAIQFATPFIIGIVKSIGVFSEGIKNFFRGVERIIVGFWNVITGKIDIGLWWNSIVKPALLQMSAGWDSIVKSVLAIIVDLFFGALATIGGFVEGFVEGVINFFKTLWERLVGHSVIPEMISDITKAFLEFFANILVKLGYWVSDMVDKIKDKVSDFVEAGKTIIRSLLEGISQIFHDPMGVLESIGIWILDTAKKIVDPDKLKAFLENGKTLVFNIINGIRDKFEAIDGLYHQLKEMIFTAAGKVVEKIQDWIDSGKDLVAGIISGLIEAASNLYQTVRDIIRNALTKGEEEAGEGSPAREWIPLGMSFMTGIGLGMDKGKSKLYKTVANIMESIKSSAEGQNPIITPQIIPTLSKFLRNQGLSTPFAFGGGGMGGGYTYIDRRVTIEMDANYKTVESEASVYYDISAALASARL